MDLERGQKKNQKVSHIIWMAQYCFKLDYFLE